MSRHHRIAKAILAGSAPSSFIPIPAEDFPGSYSPGQYDPGELKILVKAAGLKLPDDVPMEGLREALKYVDRADKEAAQRVLDRYRPKRQARLHPSFKKPQETDLHGPQHFEPGVSLSIDPYNKDFPDPDNDGVDPYDGARFDPSGDPGNPDFPEDALYPDQAKEHRNRYHLRLNHPQG